MRLLLVFPVIAVLLLSACGGGGSSDSTPTEAPTQIPDRILHLAGYDAEEGRVALALTGAAITNPQDMAVFCTGIQGGTPAELLGLLDDLFGVQEITTPQPWQTPRPGQVRDEADAERFAELLLNLCTTFFGQTTPTPAP